MKTTQPITGAGAKAFPFSVGFPLVIRQSRDSGTICGANRGEGWPILCEVPRDTHHDRDAASIVRACTALVDGKTALETAAPELLAALRGLLQWEAQMGGWEGPAWGAARQEIAKLEDQL